MSWIPDIPRTLSLIQRIETDEDPLHDATDLFWLFCNGIMNPEEFHERMNWWKGYLEEQSEKGGHFLSSEVEEIMLQGLENPDEAARRVIDRFDELVEKKYVPYLPDEPDPAAVLFIYLHLEAARLFRLRKLQGYSDITRESLEKALNAFTRCEKALVSYSKKPLSLEYSISLEAVASFLFITRFFIMKADSHYEDALTTVLEGIQHIQESYSIYTNNVRLILTSGVYFHFMKLSNEIREVVPWMKDLNQQLFVDCFEAIRKGNRINDTKGLVEICESFIELSDEPWLSNNRSQNTLMPWLDNRETDTKVKTEDYYWDNATGYWQEALGWVEAQLTPSEFKEIISEREEQAAEKRLRRYFFEAELWDKLPDRSKRSLISADRDWYSGSSARIESILNELKIAIEELFIQKFWNPMVNWFDKHGHNQRGTQEFLALKTELTDKGKMPSILDFERICKMQITGTYLVEMGVPREDRVWFIQNLQSSLFPLRQARNRAEHESGNRLIRDELNSFYSEFIGIGQPGVIRQLSKLLNSINDKNND